MPKIAIVQAKPAYLDLTKSLQKAEHFIEQAAQEGADVIVFGETWLTGYPAWLDHCPEIGFWDHEPVKRVFARMYEEGVEVPGKATNFLGDLAQKFKLHVVMGANEVITSGRGNGTIFNSLLIFGPSGDLLLHHRKLIPTFTEKLLYGPGDGAGLQTVDTSFGKIGGLICWEHFMPLTRQALHDCNEHLHVALWPMVLERHQLASRHYAFEGRCYVVAVGQLLQVKDLPPELKLPTHLEDSPEEYLLTGGSCVIGPDGNYILEPQFGMEDAMVVDLPDLKSAIKERMTLDTSGHYNRWDVFEFKVNHKRN